MYGEPPKVSSHSYLQYTCDDQDPQQCKQTAEKNKNRDRKMAPSVAKMSVYHSHSALANI